MNCKGGRQFADGIYINNITAAQLPAAKQSSSYIYRPSQQASPSSRPKLKPWRRQRLVALGRAPLQQQLSREADSTGRLRRHREPMQARSSRAAAAAGAEAPAVTQPPVLVELPRITASSPSSNKEGTPAHNIMQTRQAQAAAAA